jgi:hypothetical protein
MSTTAHIERAFRAKLRRVKNASHATTEFIKKIRQPMKTAAELEASQVPRWQL